MNFKDLSKYLQAIFSVSIVLNVAFSFDYIKRTVVQGDKLFIQIHQDTVLVDDDIPDVEWVRIPGTNVNIFPSGVRSMPDVKKLSPKDKSRLTGCIAAKNEAWRKKNKKQNVPQEVNQRHFSECSKELGLE